MHTISPANESTLSRTACGGAPVPFARLRSGRAQFSGLFSLPERLAKACAVLAVWTASAAPLAAQVEPGAPKPAAQAPVAKAPAAEDPTAEAPAARAARLAEEARLKAEFDQCLHDLRIAAASYQSAVNGLQQQGVAREQWPPHPNILYFSRFEELAYQDQPDALRWCLVSVGQVGLDLPAVLAKKNEIYARLVVVHPDLPWMSDAARWIQSDASVTSLDFERADELLRTLAANTTVRATRAAALGARSSMLAGRTDPASRAEDEKLLREIVREYSDLPIGAVAAGRLFRIENLAPGKTPPDVQAFDTEGRALRLSEYRGRVLVIEFWGFWCAPCVNALPATRKLVARHEKDPFTFLGVATDPDLEAFRTRALAEDVRWRNAWAGGGTDTPWPRSWGVQRFPTLFVLDAQGVVRFVDVYGADLDRAVQTLLDEMRTEPKPTPR